MRRNRKNRKTGMEQEIKILQYICMLTVMILQKGKSNDLGEGHRTQPGVCIAHLFQQERKQSADASRYMNLVVKRGGDPLVYFFFF